MIISLVCLIFTPYPLLDKKKFGRGAYVCKNEKCINLAKKKKAFERNMKVGNAEDIYDLLMQCWGE